MHTDIYQEIKQAAREHLMALLVLALFILQVFSTAGVLYSDSAIGGVGLSSEGQMVVRQEKSPVLSDIPKLSSLRGPQIDSEAAMVAVDEEGETVPIRTCETLPVRLWVFLLVAYVALLVFNLAASFDRRITLQWGWETVYTALALLAWFVWDGCTSATWYPLAILQMGILTYIFYLYLFERRLRAIDFEHTDEPSW